VLLLAVLAVVLTVTGAVGLLAGAVSARHRAEGAADLGALAAAPVALVDAREACRRAARVVAANGARLVRCRVDGPDVIVVVARRLEGMLGRFGAARARARAGPVPAPLEPEAEPDRPLIGPSSGADLGTRGTYRRRGDSGA
jgi:secretion/DNA translocation related TadE-like protein